MQKDPLKLVDVKFEAEWSTDLPHFLFDADMDACVLARSFSTEKWSKEFFENLKRYVSFKFPRYSFTNSFDLSELTRLTMNKWDDSSLPLQ